jgi:hypothetical protein
MSCSAKPSSLAVAATSGRAGKFLAAQVASVACVRSSVIVPSVASGQSSSSSHDRHLRGPRWRGVSWCSTWSGRPDLAVLNRAIAAHAELFSNRMTATGFDPPLPRMAARHETSSAHNALTDCAASWITSVWSQVNLAAFGLPVTVESPDDPNRRPTVYKTTSGFLAAGVTSWLRMGDTVLRSSHGCGLDSRTLICGA